MSKLTSISLPQSVPFPVTVTQVLIEPGQTLPRHQPLLKYKYWDYQDNPRGDDHEKVRVERIGTFESPITGEVEAVEVRVGENIPHSEVELCRIKEPCGHEVQYGGLCAMCGQAVDDKDYSGYSYEDRATISMAHDSTGLKISFDEAAKLEQSTGERLTNERKLILVVDLDQTVIHATVDPTVGEWQLDPLNPNYRAVKDVKSFCLEEDPIVPPGWSGPKMTPTKCWYYVKVRPGLEEFFKHVSQLYEMHVYTMATRNYALAIARIIDPDGRYFGDRILSRDESGSLTHKNLRRLFPVDQLMVVIIDDRGDVWQWEKNLIKVVPYEFFVGIGDINLSFLPKKNGQVTGPMRKRIARLEAYEEKQRRKSEGEKVDDDEEQDPHDPTGATEQFLETQTEAEDAGSDSSVLQEDETTPSRRNSESHLPDSSTSLTTSSRRNLQVLQSSPVDRIVELGGDKAQIFEQSLTRNQSLEQQQHDRPLAKLQHDLEKINHEHDVKEQTPESDHEDNLLFDDDNELDSLNTALCRVHDEYYQVWDKFNKDKSLTKPDLTTIIPTLKSECLKGIVVLFSGILRWGSDPQKADIVIWCQQFGVKVVNEVYPDVTHVICREPSAGGGLTFKVRVAKKTLPNAHIVNPDWLFACMSQWKKVDEKDYLIDASDEDFYLEEKDLVKYQAIIEDPNSGRDPRPRFDSMASMEDYDLDGASKEVDDFLADISDEDEDDPEENKNGSGKEDEEEDEEEGENNRKPDKDTFILDLYKKRGAEEDLDRATKKSKTESLDDLEQELIEGFDDLE